MGCCEHPHDHEHGPGCGHRPVRHGDHVDYLHDGHLHAPRKDRPEEHQLEVDGRRPAVCAPVECGDRHEGGPAAAVPHGNHVDYEVEGMLHHPHGDHCDLHGRL